MDIICGKCGKHFSSTEAAREHKCPGEEPLHWSSGKPVPPSKRHTRYSKLDSYRIEHPSKFRDPINSRDSGSSEASEINKIMSGPRGTKTRQSPTSHKQHSSSTFTGFIVLLLIVFILGLAGIGIYSAYSTYHERVFSWVSSEYHGLSEKIVEFKNTSAPLVSNQIDKVAEAIKSATATPQPSITTPITPKPITPAPAPVPNQEPRVSAERLAFDLINNERVKAGLSPTIWDDSLYQLSKAHTQEMANRRQLFHSDMNGPIGEDAWGGSGYSRYSGTALAQAIVESWMLSPLHRAWILNVPFQHSVVSIASDSSGQYASWTFWTAEAGDGPPLVQKAAAMWEAETGGSIPWLTWLYDIKGYPDNQEFLRQLGVK